MDIDVAKLARSLIGRMEIDEFNREVRENTPKLFPGAIEHEQLRKLFDLSKLERLLEKNVIPSPYIDLLDGGQLVKLPDLLRESGRSITETLARRLHSGSTVRVHDIDRFDDRLIRFVREIQLCYAARSQINLYLTPPGHAGFPPHFDSTDVFILQCLGSKRWTIYPTYCDKTTLPLPSAHWRRGHFLPSGATEELTLSPGDVLYLPRGEMHDTLCTDRESMHLTISIVPLTVVDVLTNALTEFAQRDVRLRRRIPWSVYDAAKSSQDELNFVVRELVDRLSLSSCLEAERQVLRKYETGTRGNLLSAVGELRALSGVK